MPAIRYITLNYVVSSVHAHRISLVCGRQLEGVHAHRISLVCGRQLEGVHAHRISLVCGRQLEQSVYLLCLVPEGGVSHELGWPCGEVEFEREPKHSVHILIRKKAYN